MHEQTPTLIADRNPTDEPPWGESAAWDQTSISNPAVDDLPPPWDTRSVFNEGWPGVSTEIYLAADAPGGALRDEMSDVATNLAKKDSILRGMGFKYKEDEGGITVKAPGVDTMNDHLRSVGHTDRRFVEFEGGDISTKEYLEFIERGEIPLSSESWFKLHDLATHGPNFILLPPRAMKLVSEKAAKALKSENEDTMQKVSSFIDVFTAGPPFTGRLQNLYREKMNNLSASVLAKKDMREVERARRTLVTQLP